MSIPKTLLGARLPGGAVRYIEVAMFEGFQNWAWPTRHGPTVAEPAVAPDRPRNPLDTLQRWGAGDAHVRALLSFGNLQVLGRNTIEVATTRIGSDATLPGPAREATSMRALRATALERGVELLAVYERGTWSGWLLAPNGATAVVGSVVVHVERALSLVKRAAEAFAAGNRSSERRGRELRASAREDIRGAARELDRHVQGRAVELLRWRGIVSDKYWSRELWIAEVRGTPKPQAITAIDEAAAEIATAIVEMRQLHEELYRSERREPLWTLSVVNSSGES